MDKLEDYLLEMNDSKIWNTDLWLTVLMISYCLRNKCDKAMECLKHIDTHALQPQWIIVEIENLPGSCGFDGDPEYQRILNSLKATREVEHERVRQWLEENDR